LIEVDALRERARAVKKGQSGVLRVGATPQVIEVLLAEFMSEFRERHPSIEIHLLEQGGARLPSSLERGDVHLAILPAGDDRFRGKLLYPMYVLAVLPVGHRLGKRRLLEVTEMDDEPLLKLDNSFASHGWFNAACSLAHVSPRVLVESASPQTTIALAQSGHGVAIVPSPVRIASRGVRVVPVVHRGAAIGKWAMAAWNPRRYLPPYAESFVDELVPRVQKAFPGIEHVKAAPRLPKPKAP
jgi:DNA-binding transcriptional LysR family regulator